MIDIRVVQKTPGVFYFELAGLNGKTAEIYLTIDPYNENSGLAKLIATTDSSSVAVAIDDLDFRPYFVIKIEGASYIVAERTLPVAGMNNFRDMGGYETQDGHHVKWGLLYRSDHIYNASEKGVQYLNQLGIRTIIDYRSSDEIEKYPNKVINEQVKSFHLDPNAHTAELSAQFTSSKQDEDINLIKALEEQKEAGNLVSRYDIVMAQYENFVEKSASQEAFREMLKIAANKEAAPIDQHCRGGKDRTGFGAMLLLGVLGVPKEKLDYMITYHNRVERNQIKMAGYKKLTDDPDILNYLYSLIETRAEFITKSIDTIIDGYGSIENYVVNALGLTEKEIADLKENYLI